MIIVKLQGGLGNQMFQYALGRSLSIKKNTSLALDISSFNSDPLRAYALEAFCAYQESAKSENIEKLSRFRRKSGKNNFFHNFFIAKWHKYASEKQFHFDPDVFKVSRDSYLDGYWNTEKYFANIRSTILEDFKLKAPLIGKNAETAELILKNDSIAVHIRRGDYANNPTTRTTHGLMGQEYYSRALAYIGEKIKDPTLFIFSDDIPWVKANLPFPFKTIYVDWNDEKHAHEDLRLMSLCKHHVIANSTFSWWGAWLSQNPNKIVIGPKQWFNQVKKSIDTRDILPGSWIKM